MEDIFGLPGMVVWLWVSAAFYSLAIAFFWQPFMKEKNGLMGAFFAFLVGMAFFHILLGAGFLLSNNLLIHIGSLAALTGSAFTLKFPLSSVGARFRKPLFYAALLLGWIIVSFMFVLPHHDQTMFWLILGYMIVFTGLITGPYIIWQGIKAKAGWAKIKSIGGGLGMMTCCLAADALVLMIGVSVIGEILMASAPVFLIFSVYAGRYVQKKRSVEKVLN